jgi:hypothetical protein
MTNRITRGFSRLGILAAMLVALGGAGITAAVSIDRYESETRWRTDHLVPPPGFVVESPVPDCSLGRRPCTLTPVDYDPFHSPSEVAARAAGIGLSITGVLALAAFGFSAGLAGLLRGSHGISSACRISQP